MHPVWTSYFNDTPGTFPEYLGFLFFLKVYFLSLDTHKEKRGLQYFTYLQYLVRGEPAMALKYSGPNERM